jgi:Family of unknown function (DUF6298)
MHTPNEASQFRATAEFIRFGRGVSAQACKCLAGVLVLLALVVGQAPTPAAEARGEARSAFRLVPVSAKILVQRQIQFSAKGNSRHSLRWYVNGVQGGSDKAGLISTSGLYTAPASVPPGGSVTVKAVERDSTRAATASVTILYETQTGTPLRRSKANPRYFENSGGIVFLAGSHTWDDLQDFGPTDPPVPLDYNAFVAFLKTKNHNFTRLWALDLPKPQCRDTVTYVRPFPWVRSGPGTASDGKPKFNLRKFNSAYFDRLRARVQQAQANGVFVAVMLFDSVVSCGGHSDGFPLYSGNNINGIDAARGEATWKQTGSFGRLRDFPFFTRYFCQNQWMTGTNPAVVEIQKAYVDKVLETLNGFDNVLWEVANEAGSYSTDWQVDMIRYIRKSEAKLPKRHPVGFTFQYGYAPSCTGETKTLLQSDADWISPGDDVGDYRGAANGPTPNDGKKVIINDTDHLWGRGGTPLWVWKSFMRGLNLLYMDVPFGQDDSQSQMDESVREAMGDVVGLSRRLPLARIMPSTTACSTGFGMVDPRNEYLCLAPAGGTFTLDLSATQGSAFSVEWFDISARKTFPASPFVSRGGQPSFSCPSGRDPWLLHLKRSAER